MSKIHIDLNAKINELDITEKIANGVHALIEKQYLDGNLSEEQKQRKTDNLEKLKARIEKARKRTQLELFPEDQDSGNQKIRAQK